jgi:hypothetical protein
MIKQYSMEILPAMAEWKLEKEEGGIVTKTGYWIMFLL